MITEPGYSRSGFQQTVIPLLDDECEARDLDVFTGEAAWLASFGFGYRTGILAVPMVSTVYQPDHIRRYLGTIVPSEVMRRVEAALAVHFGL